jgi:transcriptional regulator GlxA family with amidase domain
MTRQPRRIGILIYDGVTALDVFGPADAFAAAMTKSPTGQTPGPAYQVSTISLDSERCASESGLALLASKVTSRTVALDTLIVPGGAGLRAAETNQRVSAWIRRQAPRTRRVVCVCTGVYGLAPTGLLDGRRVTTHWRFAADFAKRFPAVRVEPENLFLGDGKYFTSAGVTAGIDLSLFLIEQDLGSSNALAVARELVVYLRRAGGQAQFSEPLELQSRSPDRFSDLVAHIAGNLDGDLSVEGLASLMAISARQLSRQCHRELGCSPRALIERLRIDEAKRLLLTRGARIDGVAACLGFQSADGFRRAFERSVGLPPSEYLRRFSRGKAAESA